MFSNTPDACGDVTQRPIKSVDLFAGAGGLTLGFHLADLGYLPVFAVEHDQAAASTFERNFGCEVFAGDIELGPAYPTEADILIGGPPCATGSISWRTGPISRPLAG